MFFLDDADALIVGHRGAYNRLGFALQLTTVRRGRFPRGLDEVPDDAVAQLGAAGPRAGGGAGVV